MLTFSGSGGFFKLDSWVLATILHLGIKRFCREFFKPSDDPCGRLFDQMFMAARSARANIAEGSARHATSRETEMKLTDVARASLAELSSDLIFFLLERGEIPWHKKSEQAQELLGIRMADPEYGDDLVHDACAHILEQRKRFAKWLDARDGVVVANALLILSGRIIRMLDRQLEHQGEAFEREGGFREKLTAVRTETRAKEENAPVCPECGKPMKKRIAKTGKVAGGAFWGCTGYPACHGTRKCEAPAAQ
jgi:four helix bundle suffix protein